MGFLSHRWMRCDMEYYEGLMNGCSPGTHGSLVALLLERCSHRTGVLDLGAGSGALLLRLRNAGFRDLHAADLAVSNFGLAGVPYTRVDLNGEFSRSFDRKFKILCLSEVIEHLDAPRRVFEQARALLEDDGWLALTTPNIGFWEGRLKFALTGELWGFGEAHYRGLRHISPLTRDQLRLMLREIGFEVVALTTEGSCRHAASVGPPLAALGAHAGSVGPAGPRGVRGPLGQEGRAGRRSEPTDEL